MAKMPGQFNELARDPELINDFIIEAGEHLSNVELQLLALDQDGANAEALHAIFRGFHTIKGLAGFLGLDPIQEVAHEIETVLDLARNGSLQITPPHIDVILAGKDYLDRSLAALKEMLETGAAPALGENEALLASIRASAKEPRLEEAVPAALSALAATQEPAQAERPAEAQAIKVDTQKLDFLVDMVGEMVIAQSLVEHDPELGLAGKPRLTRNLAQLARITAEVQRTAMSMRMIPIRQLFRKMSRLVRDLARKTGKQVELELFGEETELDRGIVENLADPLMHMVRNSIDHGIETAAERARAGKDAMARVTLRAAHQAGFILIEVSDDGRGLDAQKILKKAREKGLVEDDAELSESQIHNLIFSPGFSTAERITSVSGRGVGMDVVKKQILKLRGKIEIHSRPGQGATFYLKLPLTLAIIDGLLVGVGGEHYVLPVFAVREMFKPTEGAISTVENRHEMVLVRGSLLPVVRLHRKFGVPPKSEKLWESLLIVTEAEGKRFCLAVDELIGKQEVVIKSLGESLRNVRGVAGGAILGDGRVGLILDPDALFGKAAA
ncbi:MAG TPA: chemotaxis protein CheA [Bryobacteraceae bacterium]|jgi:two-component system chemotaxis sensor kinase CheA|nr:chemotaxis protein CheA [Bryobacteraceae bacterium]